MRNIIKRRAVLLAMMAANLLVFSGSSQASNFQNFTGINYTNTASLALLVKNSQTILGNDYLIPTIHFNGAVTVPDPSGGPSVVASGKANNSSTSNFNMTYGRYAKRMSEHLVLGLDVTQPFKSITEYSKSSVARYATIASNIVTIDIAPNFAYQFSGNFSKVTFGAGLDVTRVIADLDQMYPSLPGDAPFGAGPDSTLRNHAASWTYGWHTGLVLHALEGTFLGVGYFSPMTPNVKGTSTYSGFTNSDHLSAKINLPATSMVSLTQFFSEDLLAQLQFHYTQWSRLKRIFLNNTAGPTSSGVLDLNYHDTWEVDLGSRYNVTPKVSVGALVSYDHTPTNNQNRGLGLPEVDQYSLACSVGYKLTPTTTLDLHYAHIFMVKTVPLDNIDANTGATTIGNANTAGDLVGLQLTVDV